jgi:peroxiredoxin
MKTLAKFSLVALIALPLALAAAEPVKESIATLSVGQPAPDFKIKDSNGKEINLAELTAKGPVLVRLTCGCLGCDKELPYFQEVQRAYEGQGLVSLAIFKEPDVKVEAYVREKKLNMLYAVDTKGASWDVFKTKTMPTNFLIEKGGKISAIAAGCDTSGLLAKRLSEKAARLTGSKAVDVKAKVDAQTVAQTEPKKEPSK